MTAQIVPADHVIIDGTNRGVLRAILTDYANPDPSLVGKLPRVSCRDCREAAKKGGSCSQHQRRQCEHCKQYISTAHIHIDYVGHAETTKVLIDIDPLWSWEPVAWTEAGTPAIVDRGANLEMWGRLTVLGKTLPCVGTAPKGKDDAAKELIGDLLRNGAMRFGIALSLWSKAERFEVENDEPAAPPAPPTPPPPAEDWREKFIAACEASHLDVAAVCAAADESRPDLFLYEDTAADVQRLRNAFRAVWNANKNAAAAAQGPARGVGIGTSSEQEPGASETPPDAPAPTTSGS
jgi:hypothetical protein